MIRALKYLIVGCAIVFFGLQGWYLLRLGGNLKIIIDTTYAFPQEKSDFPRQIVVELDGEVVLDEEYVERDWLRATSLWSALGKHRLTVKDSETNLLTERTFRLLTVRWIIVEFTEESIWIRDTVMPPVFE